MRRDAIDKEGAAGAAGAAGLAEKCLPKTGPQSVRAIGAAAGVRTGAADEGVAFFWSAAIIFSLPLHLSHLAPRPSKVMFFVVVVVVVVAMDET